MPKEPYTDAQVEARLTLAEAIANEAWIDAAARKAVAEAEERAACRAASAAFLSSSGAVLLDPPLNVPQTPDAARGKLADGLREALDTRELIGPLLADAQKGCDLGDSDEFHHCSSYPLTTSSVKRYSALDNVKGGNMASKTQIRGQITYDSYFGHVCTCTAKATKLTFAGFEGEQGEHDWTTYENTVECDPSSGTESGTFTYRCTRCGAIGRSGL